MNIKKFLSQITPFIFIGAALVAFAFSIFILAYLFLFGAIVGIILYIMTWIRNRFFITHQSIKPKRPGRVIDLNDWTRKD